MAAPLSTRSATFYKSARKSSSIPTAVAAGAGMMRGLGSAACSIGNAFAGAASGAGKAVRAMASKEKPRASKSVPTLCSLPFIGGSSFYDGFIQHPGFGGESNIRLVLIIEGAVDPLTYRGRWSAMNQVEEVLIKICGSRGEFEISNQSGKVKTVLKGLVNASSGEREGGRLSGELIQDSIGGGKFELKPAASNVTF